MFFSNFFRPNFQQVDFHSRFWTIEQVRTARSIEFHINYSKAGPHVWFFSDQCWGATSSNILLFLFPTSICARYFCIRGTCTNFTRLKIWRGEEREKGRDGEGESKRAQTERAPRLLTAFRDVIVMPPSSPKLRGGVDLAPRRGCAPRGWRGRKRGRGKSRLVPETGSNQWTYIGFINDFPYRWRHLHMRILIFEKPRKNSPKTKL